ncbi:MULTISPECIES: HhH-GPD family protein [Actinotignum]|uniref:A/G-specific adenine glycosylase n=1 Tax=Actinotignum TaxID=1653174 RepID=UPI00254A95CC|nr:A/G-specific adenine glycosylase [Actinotignum schaalii]MDE1536359.1 A/G-specific adenine glycosylase [Actinotignum schaalii]MDK7271805.1 A/G-specific adenine glycosylase [Actinotignum schaalii]
MLKNLLRWYDGAARSLPWRAPGTSPWAILVCEVMSQQTPVARVAPAWRAWLERWPTPTDLAAAAPADVLIMWDRLGYPRRALRLRECAIALVERHGGRVPRTREELLALPGIGPYTADALLAFAFQERSVVLDTNIRRVLARVYDGVALPPTHQTVRERERAAALVPTDGPGAARWNAALMELGALVCTAREPACSGCPLRAECRWLAAGKPKNAAPRTTQKFTGTQREARGKIMAVLRKRRGGCSRADLVRGSKLPEERFAPALTSLLKDGLAQENAGRYCLPVAESATAGVAQV